MQKFPQLLQHFRDSRSLLTCIPQRRVRIGVNLLMFCDTKMGVPKTMKSQIDLEKIVQNYAWKRYLCSMTMGKAKKLLIKREKFAVDFQWSFFQFAHTTKMTPVEAEDELLNSLDFGTPNRNLRPSKRFKKIGSPRCFYKSVSTDFDEPVCLETMTCENTTKSPQQHHISSEKSTNITLSVEFLRNYCLGETTNIELSISENDFSSSSQLSIENQCLFVTNTKQQDFVNVSDVDLVGTFTVKPGHVTKASLLARKETETREFEVKTTLSLVIGCLPVVVRRKSDGKTMFTCFITSLEDVFRHWVGDNLSLVENEHSDVDVTITSSGRCKLTKWSEAQLMVHSECLCD